MLTFRSALDFILFYIAGIQTTIPSTTIARRNPLELIGVREQEGSPPPDHFSSSTLKTRKLTDSNQLDRLKFLIFFVKKFSSFQDGFFKHQLTTGEHLFKVIKHGHFFIACLLLENGTPTNFYCNGDNTLLQATCQGSLAMVSRLIKAGAGTGNFSGFCNISLREAVRRNFTEISNILLHHGADLNTRNRDGEFALFLAASNGNTDILQSLVNAGARLDKRNKFGATALHIASEKGHADSVEVLLSAKANPNLRYKKESSKYSAIQLAIENNHSGIAERLKVAGAIFSSKITNALNTLRNLSKFGRVNMVELMVRVDARRTFLAGTAKATGYMIQGSHRVRLAFNSSKTKKEAFNCSPRYSHMITETIRNIGLTLQAQKNGSNSCTEDGKEYFLAALDTERSWNVFDYWDCDDDWDTEPRHIRGEDFEGTERFTSEVLSAGMKLSPPFVRETWLAVAIPRFGQGGGFQLIFAYVGPCAKQTKQCQQNKHLVVLQVPDLDFDVRGVVNVQLLEADESTEAQTQNMTICKLLAEQHVTATVVQFRLEDSKTVVARYSKCQFGLIEADSVKDILQLQVELMNTMQK